MPSTHDAGREKSGAIGRVLDSRYRIDSVVGKGGMATVYLANDLRMNRSVIIKIPHAEFLDSGTFRERFAREIRSLTTLEHPHIVKILDVGEFDEHPYAVLQYLKGGTLKDRLVASGGTMRIEDILIWIRPVAETLDYVHAQGIVHRDLTPSNILFDGGGHVFLTDFGIAKALEGLSASQTLTRTGVAPGSAQYMGPEAVEGTLGPGYDQYALGVIVYRLLTGNFPHEGPTPVAILVGKVTKPPRPLAEVAPELLPSVSYAIMKTLAVDPEHRYLSCRAFVEALEAALAGTGAAAEPEPPPAGDTSNETELVKRAGASSLEDRRRSAPRRYFWVPSQADCDFGRAVVDEKVCQVQEVLLTLDLQEKRCELGDRVSLEELLSEQGFVDYEEKRRIREMVDRKDREESDRLFSKCAILLGVLSAQRIEEFKTRQANLRRVGRDHLLSELLVREGALREEDSVRVYHGQLQSRYAREDGLLRRVLLDTCTVASGELEKAVARQKELNAQGLPPLPLHSVLMGMGLIDKTHTDAARRAVRRHLLTGLPLAEFHSDQR